LYSSFNSETQKDKLIDYLIRLLYVVRNAACHRALSKYKNQLNQNYWILIFNNFFDIAILDWCKVFGSESEPTHWKNIVDDPSSFRQGLLSALGIDQSNWETYWKDVKDYRDKYLAHHQNDPSRTHYPNLDIAVNSSFYFYKWLINKLKIKHFDFDPYDLKEYYESFISQASKFVEVSYQSTKKIEEEVF